MGNTLSNLKERSLTGKQWLEEKFFWFLTWCLLTNFQQIAVNKVIIQSFL